MLAGWGTAAAAALITTLSILDELPKTNGLGNASFKELGNYILDVGSH